MFNNIDIKKILNFENIVSVLIGTRSVTVKQLYICIFINRINNFCNQYKNILSVVQLLFKISNYQFFDKLLNQSTITILFLNIIYSNSK